MKFVRAATLAVGVAMIAFVALALYGNTIPSAQSATPLFPQGELFTSTPVQASATPQTAAIVCDEDDESLLCHAMELDKSLNAAYTGNGKARPAVAKDSILGDGQLHGAAHINDGIYGLSASWVSNSPNSWIKIDLGSPTAINTVTFGRDRLGTLNEGDPGRFVIAVAIADNVYADGNSSNDEREYVQVFDSEQAGFDGTISGPETVVALFDLNQARFIKITFENARTVIDEVEAFVTNPFLAAIVPTKVSAQREIHPSPSTPLPANTPVPTDTATAMPIDTLPPTDTVTPVPTATLPPAETSTPVVTPTPIDPTVPPSTDTPLPPPSYTPFFMPTDEPTPADEEIPPMLEDVLDLIEENIQN
jgi:hypothetical protein